jgi:DNA-binding response OmpR family regulator
MNVSAAPLTVLIADPDPAQQQILVECLRPRFRTITARTLAETSDLIARYRPQILLLELNQPDGDGLNLVRQLRKEAATKSMIIACVTRRSTVKEKVAGFQAGANDYLVKPVNIETFMWRIVLLVRAQQLMYY